jgi:hypothetical protein
MSKVDFGNILMMGSICIALQGSVAMLVGKLNAMEESDIGQVSTYVYEESLELHTQDTHNMQHFGQMSSASPWQVRYQLAKQNFHGSAKHHIT